MENKAFKIAGIRNLMITNYGLTGKELDLEALVDDNISMAENWHNCLKPKVFALLEPTIKMMYDGRI